MDAGSALRVQRANAFGCNDRTTSSTDDSGNNPSPSNRSRKRLLSSAPLGQLLSGGIFFALALFHNLSLYQEPQQNRLADSFGERRGAPRTKPKAARPKAAKTNDEGSGTKVGVCRIVKTALLSITPSMLSGTDNENTSDAVSPCGNGPNNPKELDPAKAAPRPVPSSSCKSVQLTPLLLSTSLAMANSASPLTSGCPRAST